MHTDKYNMKLMPPSFSAWEPKNMRSKQMAVLMSGGVDSSVAAHLLTEAGWEVLGITMKIPACTTTSRPCCGADVVVVCNELGIPHYYIDVTEAFEKLIIEPFRKSYAGGQTPNPCIDCNTFLKFSLVWDFVEETFGINSLATGHYARIIKTDNGVWLGRANDKTKDQSYFIYGIAREKLANFVLPVGELTKEKVCSIAAELNLSVADKAESMELCFAGEGDYRAVLSDADANQSGDITDMQGNKIGTHKGIANYTLGQRRGIGFAGGEPLYVGKMDAQANTIALGTREEISSAVICADKVNVLIPQELVAGRLCYGKIRSYGDPRPCKIVEADDTNMTVEFDKLQFAPCPGQSLVLYNSNDYVIAGGTITNGLH